MRIGLTGTHSTGKSTLVKAVIERFSDYSTVTQEESRRVVAKGLGINFETSLESQREFMHSFIEMMSEPWSDNFITSRTLIDLCAYNLYFFRRPKYGLTQKFVDQCRDLMLNNLKQWDLYVYTPIEFKLTEDNEFRKGQKDAPEYQIEVDTYVQALLMNYGIPFVTVTGSVEERVAQIGKAIGKI